MYWLNQGMKTLIDVADTQRAGITLCEFMGDWVPEIAKLYPVVGKLGINIPSNQDNMLVSLKGC